MTLPFIVCASVTAISAIISLGFSIAAALGATDTARTIALYACARSTALMIGSAVPFLTGDDPSVRWVERDKLWGLGGADGSWLVEPKFQQADSLSDGLARVTLNRKVGFIDRTGNFVIEP